MPFKSEKQRRYLWANEPEIAREWTDKYGSRVKKDNGGVMDIINKYIGPSEAHMYDWGKALGAKNKPWSTTPEYHQWGAENLATHGAENWNNLFPGLGEAFKRTAPFIAGAASPIYDIPQGISRYHEKPWEYETNNKWDKINAYFPDLQGTTVSGILNAIDKEDPLSAAYNRMIGAAQPWIKDKFINRPNQIKELFGKGWDAIKNEFGGSAEAATLGNLIRPRSQASQAPQRRDTWNVKRRLEGHEDWMGGPLMEYGQYGMPDLNKMYRLGMNELLKRNKPISYSETDIIPSEYPYANMAQKTPYKGSRYSIKDMKNIRFNQDGSRFMTKAEYDNLNLDEDDPYIDPNRIPGRIQKSLPRNMGILEKFRNRFYKPATRPAGGYGIAQLNRMNALGGQYSEPAREQRRQRSRVSNMLARQAAGKSYSQKNLNQLTMGSRPGHYDPPGGGGAAADTSPSTPGNNPWGR